jgi:hypothetical protein
MQTCINSSCGIQHGLNPAKGYTVFYTGMPGTQASFTIIICSCSGSMLSSDHGMNLYRVSVAVVGWLCSDWNDEDEHCRISIDIIV